MTNTPWPAVQPAAYTPRQPHTVPPWRVDERTVPSRAALVLVDFQNDFCHPRGAWASVAHDATVAAVTERVQGLLPVARRAGVPVLHLRTVHNDWTVSDLIAQVWSSAGVGPICWEGSWGWEFFGIEPAPEDRVVAKFRASGFLETDLELTLRAKQVETLLMAGMAAPGGLFETAYDAVGRDHAVVLLDDCIGGATPEEREVLSEVFCRSGAGRASSGTLLRAWRRA